MIKNCVSLSSRVEEPNSEVKKLLNVHTWTTESPVYLTLPIVLMCCIIVVTEMIIVAIQQYPGHSELIYNKATVQIGIKFSF